MNNSTEQAGLSVEAVDALEGRTLDAAIATYIMGWKKVRTNDVAWYGQPPGVVWSTEDVPNYSMSIEAAWQIVEHLRKQSWYLLRLTNGDTNYACYIGRGIVQGPYHYAVEDTAPLAICKAALKATLTTGAA